MRYLSTLPSWPGNRQLLPLLRCTGLINPAVTGIIGSGVVVHLPSFFDEFDSLREKGNNRLIRTLVSRLADAEQVWIPRADFSFPIERISSLTSTRSSTG